jgi:hypothetical protein
MRLAVVFALALGAVPSIASAQDAGPHHVRAGAHLALADEDTKLLFAVMTAKVFDVELTKTLSGDLKKAIAEAKSSVFRASALTEDQKLEADFKKLQEALKRAEDAQAKLDGDIKAETSGLTVAEDDNPDLEAAAGSKPEAAKQPKWELLKEGAGALYKEIGDARALHGKLAKALKTPALKAPPAPKAKK